jgi:hypothetical protein
MSKKFNSFIDVGENVNIIDSPKSTVVEKSNFIKKQQLLKSQDGMQLSKFATGLEFDLENEKLKVKTNLDNLKSMSVEEFTFYKKWDELKHGGYEKSVSNFYNKTLRKIWTLDGETDPIKRIECLDPEVVFVGEDSVYYEDWNLLRIFCHTMEYNQNPGRFLRFLIIDKTTKKYIGVLSIASDVISITDRDNYIGWTSDNRLKDKKLVYSAIGSCIMPTQPFGYNFLGGKLVACLATSDVIRKKWKDLYGQTLAGMTTTSLYGSYSMYNSLNRWWHKCGVSSGQMLIKPDQSCYDQWHKYVKQNMSDEYEKAMTQKEGVNGPVTAAKLRVLSMIMESCGLRQKDYVHGFERGTYYSCFYENTREFLKNEISDDKLIVKPLFHNSIQNILDWWKPKAIERYKRLKSENKLKPEVLSYHEMIGMTYEEAKRRFFNEVGR